MRSVGFFANAGAWARRNVWWSLPAIIFSTVVAYIAIVVAPFSRSIDEPSDVPSAWNKGVGQLGISPLYPPQEDFFVGDIWAVIVDSPDPAITGRGVRVGHIDLSDAMKSEGSRAPAFLRGANGDASRYLYALAFPGISIYHSAANSGRSWLPLFSLNASRAADLSDQINITEAQTYGADLVEALIKFYNYCGAPSTEINCKDGYIRRVLSTIMGGNIEKTTKTENTKFKIRLHLVTRVYLTSGITHKRVVDGTVSLVGSAQTSNATRSGAGNQSALPNGEIARKIGDKSELSFQEKFTTPLVFGFRSAVFKPN